MTKQKIVFGFVFSIVLLLTVSAFGYNKTIVTRIPDGQGGYGIDLTGLGVGDEFYLDDGVKCRIESITIE